MMQMKVKVFGKVVGIALLVYFFLSATFYFFQDRFIFQAKKLPAEYQFQFDHKFEEYFISTHDGEKLSALLFRTEQESKGLILYFHGNAKNLQRWGEYAIDFTSLGYDVFMVDYRGYGKSTGLPSEENLYNDAEVILKWVNANLPHAQLIIYGRSLGAAVATNLATRSTPDLLILETPFDKLSSALYLFSSKYSFSNSAMLPNVKCNKVIIHGTDDGVVHFSSALRLKPLLSNQDHFIVIKGGSHNNLRGFKEYHQALEKLLN